jgi:hypothetical protein
MTISDGIAATRNERLTPQLGAVLSRKAMSGDQTRVRILVKPSE